MNATVLVPTVEMEHEQWLEARRKGIGGSDAAAIAGLNKWKSPVQVYLEKIRQAPEDEAYVVDSNGAFVSGNEAAYWGNKNEDKVAEEFALRSGLKVRRRNAILQHPEHEWMIANVDRLIVGERTGLECKTASEYMKDAWKDDEVPAPYLIQCQHYMAVTGYDAWWIAVLIGGNKFVYKKIDRDDELIGYLIDIERDFWENHVVKRVPPAFDGSNASSDLLKVLYPDAEPESETELPSEADELIDQWEKAKEDEKEAAERRKEAENKLKGLLGEFETGLTSEHIVTWKSITSNRLDSRKLRKDKPEIYEQYAKTSTYRRFSIKEAK